MTRSPLKYCYRLAVSGEAKLINRSCYTNCKFAYHDLLLCLASPLLAVVVDDSMRLIRVSGPFHSSYSTVAVFLKEVRS